MAICCEALQRPGKTFPRYVAGDGADLIAYRQALTHGCRIFSPLWSLSPPRYWSGRAATTCPFTMRPLLQRVEQRLLALFSRSKALYARLIGDHPQ